MTSSSTEATLAAPRRDMRLAAVIATLALIAFILLAAEGAIRIRQTLRFGSTQSVEDYWTLDPKSGLRVPIAGFTSGRVSINSLGFRGPEIAVPKPPGTLRLAFLGASTTWCGEVSGQDKVWPHRVTAELGQTFPGARLDYVNAAVPGYTLDSMLKSLQHRVAPLQPDVIVIYEAGNNFSDEMRQLAAAQGIIAEAKMHELSWPSRYSVLWNLVEKNLLVRQAQRMARANQGRLTVDPATLGEKYRQALTELVKAAQQQAPLVAVATFSIQLRPGQSPEQQARTSESAFFFMPFVTPRLLIDGYARYNQVAREVAAETGALLIGGENDIPGDPLHFVDTVHFSDGGAQAMADRIHRGLATSPVLRKLVIDAAPAR